MDETAVVLARLEGKFDLLAERIETKAVLADEKLRPVVDRVSRLESTSTFLARAMGTTIIGLLSTAGVALVRMGR